MYVIEEIITNYNLLKRNLILVYIKRYHLIITAIQKNLHCFMSQMVFFISRYFAKEPSKNYVTLIMVIFDPSPYVTQHNILIYPPCFT